MRTLETVVLAAGLLVALGGPATAQPAAQTTAAPVAAAPRVVADGALGWAGFGDEGIIHHTLIGAAWRGYVTRRISLGPEVPLWLAAAESAAAASS